VGIVGVVTVGGVETVVIAVIVGVLVLGRGVDLVDPNVLRTVPECFLNLCLAVRSSVAVVVIVK